MEFLTRHQRLLGPGGVEVLVDKTMEHQEFLNLLLKPDRIWTTPGIVLDHSGKNRIGHGEIQTGFTHVPVFVKEFLPKSPLDTVLSFGRFSRAARAFLAGMEMCRLELPTPQPLASVTQYFGGWVRRSWLLTAPLQNIASLRDVMDHPERHSAILDVWPWPRLLGALGRLLAQLDATHVVHRDLSLRNILVETPSPGETGDPRLWIIDLNRVLTLGPDRWTISLASRNWQRLRLDTVDFDRVIEARFPDPKEREASRGLYERARARHVRYKSLKKIPRRA